MKRGRGYHVRGESPPIGLKASLQLAIVTSYKLDYADQYGVLTGSALPRQDIEPHGIFVLPPVLHCSALHEQDRRWLSRGRIERVALPLDLFSWVLETLAIELPDSGLAALRLWGQTGDRPTAWIAAADPVYLEARLNHVRVHALGDSQLAQSELRDVLDFLQQSLGSDRSVAFARVGRYAYLRGNGPMATARCCAASIDGLAPDEYLPAGDGADIHDRLASEIQMSLHEHDINVHRDSEGLQPINSLWIWGGGVAPLPDVRPLPVLFSDDPLLRGYWHSCLGVAENWSENFDDFLQLAVKGFVATSPMAAGTRSDDVAVSYVSKLRQLLVDGKLRRMTLLFGDGVSVDLGPRDSFRFWRSTSRLFPEAGN